MIDKKEYKRLWYTKNRERVLALRKLYYQEHRERVLVRVSTYRCANKVKIAGCNRRYRISHATKIKRAKKIYASTHREQQRISSRKYYHTHPKRKSSPREKAWHAKYYQRRRDWFRKLGAEYYLEHGAEIREQVKNYRKHHPEISAVARHNRRARIKAAGGKLSLSEVQRIYEENITQFGTLTCYLCGLSITFGNDTLDHKTPLIRGGANKPSNLAVAHRHCNSRKNRRTEAEYREYLKCLI